MRRFPWIITLYLLLSGTCLAALTDDQRQRGLEATARLNLYRRLSGLPDVVLDEGLSVGCSNHAAYLDLNTDQVQNGLDAHNEYSGRPGYTPEGAEAGPNSDINYAFTGASSVDAWYRTYYHRNPLVNHGVIKVGYGDHPGTNLGFSIAVLRFQTYVWPSSVLTPGDGSEGCATFANCEVPEPISGFGASMGNPIIAYFSGSAVSWQSSTVTANGVALSHYVVAPTHYGVNEICLITKSVLPADTVISVSIGFTQNCVANSRNWSFRTSATGPFDPVAAEHSLEHVNRPPVIVGPAAEPSSPASAHPVSFSVQASDPNGDPMTYSWDFGDGLHGTGATVSHSYSVAKTYAVVVTVSDNRYGQATGNLSLTVRPNSPPVMSSSVVAVPSDPTVSQQVRFSASADDADQDPLVYLWDFGDGNSGNGPSVTHAYPAEGTYRVAVRVSDNRGGGIVGETTISVAYRSNSGLDTDGDGFPDEVELADDVGSDPDDPASTPFGWTATGTSEATVEMLLVKLNLRVPGRDVLRVSGTLPLGLGTTLEGQPVAIDVGGVVRAFVLDAKGNSIRDDDRESFRVSGGRFSAKLGPGNLFDEFRDEGFVNASVSKQVLVPVIVLVGQGVFRTELRGYYGAKVGRKGTYFSKSN